MTTPVRNPDVLELRNVSASYGRTAALWDVSLGVPKGSIAALLGPNGAGKSTLLKVAAGVLKPSEGRVLIDGDNVTTASPNARARKGLCLIPEGHGVYPRLTVRENLLLLTPPWLKGESTDKALDAFPALRSRLGDRAGTLSGGQQQMVALARCHLANPSIVLLDEVSMGLAPLVVDEIFDSLKALAASGVTLLIVEQFVTRALEMADTVHLLNRGRISFSGPPSELDEAAVLEGYLGSDIARDRSA
jgi:branched-chain amino acid transport system ATP-binding protein